MSVHSNSGVQSLTVKACVSISAGYHPSVTAGERCFLLSCDKFDCFSCPVAFDSSQLFYLVVNL